MAMVAVAKDSTSAWSTDSRASSSGRSAHGARRTSAASGSTSTASAMPATTATGQDSRPATVLRALGARTAGARVVGSAT